MALSLCSCAVLLASCRASADTRTGQADGYGGILRVQVMANLDYAALAA